MLCKAKDSVILSPPLSVANSNSLMAHNHKDAFVPSLPCALLELRQPSEQLLFSGRSQAPETHSDPFSSQRGISRKIMTILNACHRGPEMPPTHPTSTVSLRHESSLPLQPIRPRHGETDLSKQSYLQTVWGRVERRLRLHLIDKTASPSQARQLSCECCPGPIHSCLRPSTGENLLRKCPWPWAVTARQQSHPE